MLEANRLHQPNMPPTISTTESPHTLDELQTFKNSAFLNTADFLAVKNAVRLYQLSFSPCSCGGPFLPGKVKFTIENTKSHAGLGSVPSRFKCNSQDCRNSFSALEFLIKFSSWNPDLSERGRTETNVSSSQKRPKISSAYPSESQDLFTQPTIQSSAQPPVSSSPASSTTNDIQQLLTQLLTTTNHLAAKITTLTDSHDNIAQQFQHQQSLISSLESRMSHLESTHSSTPSTPLTSPTLSPPHTVNVTITKPLAPTTESNISYAQAVASINTEIRSQGIAALRQLHRYNDPSSRPPPSKETAAIYIAGFQWQKIRMIRDALFDARFQLRRVHKISWIGKTIIEVILSSDYKTQFANEITAAGYKVISLDPTNNPRAPNQEGALLAKQRFAVRAVKTILSTRSELVEKHFRDLVAKSDDVLKEIFAKEMNIALETRKENIETLVGRLEHEDLNDSERQELVAELRSLSPNHPLFQSASDEMAVAPGEGDGGY